MWLDLTSWVGMCTIFTIAEKYQRCGVIMVEWLLCMSSYKNWYMVCFVFVASGHNDWPKSSPAWFCTATILRGFENPFWPLKLCRFLCSFLVKTTLHSSLRYKSQILDTLCSILCPFGGQLWHISRTPFVTMFFFTFIWIFCG